MDAIISKNTRIRYPEDFRVGKFSIVDDFCYFSTRVEIGMATHIAPNCTVGGGREYLFQVGDYSSVSSGVRVYCASNDYVNDLVVLKPAGTNAIGDNLVCGDVLLGNYTGVGANAVIMPGNNIPEGVAIGSLSYIPAFFQFEPWTVYAGIPAKPVKVRNRERILDQIKLMDLNTGRV